MRRHGWWVLGSMLVVAEVVVALTTAPGPTDLGWIAYTPLSEPPEWQMSWSGDRSVHVVGDAQLVGWAASVVGLLLLAGSLGSRLGRRRGE